MNEGTKIKLDEFKEAMNVAIQDAIYKSLITILEVSVELVPVVTGRLKNSLTFGMDEGEMSGWVGTNVEYAEKIEKGGSQKAPAGYLRPACDEKRTETINRIAKAIKEVKI